MSDVFGRLAAEGVSVWLDDSSLALSASGGLPRLVAAGRITGVASHPTVSAEALRRGSVRREELRDLAARGATAEEAVWDIAVRDVRRACDQLLPVHRRTGGRDGLVSVDIDPRNAWDAGAATAEARALWREVDRPNLMVRIPATARALPAVTACLAEGIGVNASLIFSLDRYREVTRAFLEGLERAAAAGRDLSRIASVASFFLGRLDREVDGLLDKAGSEEARALRGRAAVANARLAYAAYEGTLTGGRWRTLEALGARPQRLLWAAVGTHDPRYVEELVAPGTVVAVPEVTLRAVADRAQVRGDRVRRHYADARRVLSYLEWFGISYKTVASSLEAAELRASVRSREELLADMGSELRARGGVLAKA